MRNFKAALWDGSDPLYAPCISWNGSNPALRYPTWKCPARYVKAGYSIRRMKIDPPGTPEDEHQTTRAAQCRELTRQLETWWNNRDQPRIDPNTWLYLIARYQTDEFSPIQEVKPNTRAGYIEQLDKLKRAIGKTKISDMTYEQIKRLQLGLKQKGRSVAYIHRFFNTLRRVARYGQALQIPEASAVASIMSDMRFQASPSRQIAPTREQVYRIIAAADAEGLAHYAVGIMIQYELALRAVDVRGQWLITDEQEGGIIRNGKRWADGLTWDMFDTDLTCFEKVISKTRKSMPEPYLFELTDLPEIRERLLAIRPETPVGPVILSTQGDRLPYTTSGWSQAWARLRRAAGLPSDIWMMDLRAGAVTEAKELGADPYALRDAAQHSTINTTNRYSRARSAGANKVVQLRRGK